MPPVVNGLGPTTEIPADIRCPITLNLMWGPVTTPCGHNFSEAGIIDWIQSNNGVATCPVCRAYLVEAELTPNPELAQRVGLFNGAHPEFNPWAPPPAPRPAMAPIAPPVPVQVQATTPIMPAATSGIMSDMMVNAFRMATRVSTQMPNIIQAVVTAGAAVISNAIGVLLGIIGGFATFFSGQPALTTNVNTQQNTAVPTPAVLHPVLQPQPKPFHPLATLYMNQVATRARLQQEQQRQRITRRIAPRVS